MVDFRVSAAGDSALLISRAARIDPAINSWCTALARELEHALGTTLRDVVVGYNTVTVYFDPLAADPRWLEAEVRRIASTLDYVDPQEGPLLEIPVVYGGEWGPDLGDVANFGGCSEDEAIRIHTGRIYRVYLVGFVPGFAYMAEVDSRIAAPRRAMPRTSVPAGSVAIAGGQTGVYPAPTPGGWNIIGRTPVKPYDPARSGPFLFAAGDRVRFVAIPADDFARLA